MLSVFMFSLEQRILYFWQTFTWNNKTGSATHYVGQYVVFNKVFVLGNFTFGLKLIIVLQEGISVAMTVNILEFSFVGSA